jgi:hypothetical protein
MRQRTESSRIARRVGRLIAGLILASTTAVFANKPSGPCCAECGGGASTVCCSGCQGCIASDGQGCGGMCNDQTYYSWC